MIDNIIKLPGIKRNKKQIKNVLVDKLTNFENQTDMGTVLFTCPQCSNKSSFEFNNAIFKNVTFHCSGCGNGFKLTNPIFSDNSKNKFD